MTGLVKRLPSKAGRPESGSPALTGKVDAGVAAEARLESAYPAHARSWAWQYHIEMVSDICNPKICGVKTTGSGVRGHAQLHGRICGHPGLHETLTQKKKGGGPMECNCISSSGDQRQTEPWRPNIQGTPDSVRDPVSINEAKPNRGRQCQPTSGFHTREHMCADKNRKGNLGALLTSHMNLRICFSIPQRRCLRLQWGLNGICKSPILF